MADKLLALVRYVVFAAFALAVVTALGAWLVRTRRVSPLGPLGRALRQVTGPMLRPVEARVVRAGGTPTQAGWWLVIGVAILGILVVWLAQWLVGAWYALSGAAAHGVRDVLGLVVQVAWRVLLLAIFARVIASWFGVFRYSRWMRPAYVLTDWIVEPIRRLLPRTGAFDLSPLVAVLVLYLLKSFVLLVLL